PSARSSRTRPLLPRACARGSDRTTSGAAADRCQTRVRPLRGKLSSGSIMDLVDACAIVTGGASGIGEATVAALQAAGARVAVLDQREAPAADVSLTVDVGEEEQVIAGVREAGDRLGGLDVGIV